MSDNDEGHDDMAHFGSEEAMLGEDTHEEGEEHVTMEAEEGVVVPEDATGDVAALGQAEAQPREGGEEEEEEESHYSLSDLAAQDDHNSNHNTINDDSVGDYDAEDNAGTEVAPAKHILDADAPDTELAEEDLPDAVGSDVRPPALQMELELMSPQQEEEEENQQVRQGGGSWRQQQESAEAQIAQARLNPSQGTQAEPQVDALIEEGAATAPAQPQPHHPEVFSLQPQLQPLSMVEPAKVVEQAYEGTVSLTLTLMPMNARALLTLTVHRTASTSSSAAGTSSSGGDGWVLVAKDLFEAVAAHLRVHPQTFHLYRGNERIRFMSALFLDRTVSSTTQAEPLWLTVAFSSPDGDDGIEDAETARLPEPYRTLLRTDKGFGREPIPAHLAQLAPGDVLLRCFDALRRKPDIQPNTLVEARLRHGLTYDAAIRAINADPDFTNDPDVATTIAVVQPAGTGPWKKPFIGGYRDKADHSRVFHHASTQLFMRDLNYSPFPEKRVPVTDLQSRQTQTCGTSRSCQTRRECGVQSPRPDLILDTSHEIRVVARPYFSAAELVVLRTEKTIILQKLYRQWKARRLRRQLEEAEAEKQRRAEVRQRAEEAARAAMDNEEQQRREDPKTAADFDSLKREIEQWRATEAAAINANTDLSPEERRGALLALTKQQLKLMQELEHHRRQMLLGTQDKRFDKTLEKMSTAKQWGAVAVETPETERAAELRDLFHSVTSAAPNTATRLDILIHIKWTVKEFSSELTRELCQLIDREADLLHRGRKEASLAGLRKRIETLFRRFIEDPEYNPGMAEYTSTATGRMKARKIYGTVYPQDIGGPEAATFGRSRVGTSNSTTAAAAMMSKSGNDQMRITTTNGRVKRAAASSN